ncbi:TrkH family potassium uptake protein [Shimazuella kribbensis]|uniref:TrkH family potassium uptake protein n=1 Tax=Shimazuella kribbensis TaxID=139808 RepID=UPI0004124719|nr:TrkH family potassium uptake protein [Shimazuella kribbensis]
MIKKTRLNTSQILILVFLFILFLGTILLKIPIATKKSIDWIDAWFMATSAITCTGLATTDVGTTFTLFGQIVILLLVKIGGLGIMVSATIFFLLLGKRLSMKERHILSFSLNQDRFGNIMTLVKKLILYSFLFEAIGALALFINWIFQMNWKYALYYSVFHSIASFNNAGFALWPDNLIRQNDNPFILLIVSSLIIIGGIGFTVLLDVWNKRSFHSLSLHSKVMIIGTICLIFSGMIILFLLEFQNPKSMGNLPLNEQLWASYFQSVTLRTAGFNTIDIGGLQEYTLFFMCLFMFVGAGSTSTGGGIKVSTFTVILLSVISYLKGKRSIHLFRKSIDSSLIINCLAISFVSLMFIALAVFLLTITEDAPFIICLFEVISAFGTVGLTANFTFDLSMGGKIIIGVMMFIGKIGPITVLLSLSREEKRTINYPKEEVLIG